MLQNGHILLSNADNGPDLTSTSGVVELDMLGYVHKKIMRLKVDTIMMDMNLKMEI